MNTTTKVFVVLNLIMALLVFYAAVMFFAYNENWKRRWHKDTKMMAEQLTAEKSRITQLTFDESVSRLNFERATADLQKTQAEVATLQTQITALKGDLETAKADVASRDDQITAKDKQIQTLQNSLDIARKRMTELNHIAQVSRSVAFQLSVKLAEVEDDLNNANTELTRREATIHDLEQAMKGKDARLALVRERYPRVYSDVSSGELKGTTLVRGIVAAVRMDPQGKQDLVMLTVGKDVEVQEGMEFIVYRGNQYIVKVRAERVLDDMAACRVVQDTWNTRGTEIKQGDLAQNRLF